MDSKLAKKIDTLCEQHRNYGGHPRQHADIKRENCIERAIFQRSDVSCYSRFKNPSAFMYCFAKAITDNASKIQSWLDKASDGDKREFTTQNPKGVPAQVCYQHKPNTEYGVQELASTETTMRVICDRSVPGGFVISSVWPEARHAKPTGNDLTELIKRIDCPEFRVEQLRQQAIEESKVPDKPKPKRKAVSHWDRPDRLPKHKDLVHQVEELIAEEQAQQIRSKNRQR